MKIALILSALALSAGLAAQPVLAADARSPYKGVNHKDDAGNDTGDSKVDELNAAQLDSNYYKTHQAPPAGAVVVPAH